MKPLTYAEMVARGLVKSDEDKFSPRSRRLCEQIFTEHWKKQDRERSARRKARIEAGSSILDLETGATYCTKREAAKGLRITVAEVERLLAVCWLVRLVLPKGLV